MSIIDGVCTLLNGQIDQLYERDDELSQEIAAILSNALEEIEELQLDNENERPVVRLVEAGPPGPAFEISVTNADGGITKHTLPNKDNEQ